VDHKFVFGFAQHETKFKFILLLAIMIIIPLYLVDNTKPMKKRGEVQRCK